MMIRVIGVCFICAAVIITPMAQLRVGRSVVRAQHGMVASSQPLASQTGLEILKRGRKDGMALGY